MIQDVKNRVDSLIRKLRAAHQPIILMYHRVIALDHDPWALAVSPENFQAQVEHLKSVRQVVPLSDILANTGSGADWRKAAITFDDGYADIYTTARPILQALNCPATVFLTTGAIEGDREFWWDELTRIMFEPASLPNECVLRIEDRAQRWLVGYGAAARRVAHDEIWRAIRPLSAAARRECLDQLARWAGVSLAMRETHRAMTRAEVQDLRTSTITIGAHTVNHPRLPELAPEQMAWEINESRQVCEQISGEAVTSFAYPFGDHDALTVQTVKGAGFSLACTVETGGVGRGADPLRLRRLAVSNMDRTAFARWLP